MSTESMPEAPPAGSSRDWNPNVKRVAEELERITREWRTPVRASTYPGHGRTGEAWGIDLWVEDFRQQADKVSEEIGDRIQKYVDANSVRLGIAYEIWWGWMREHPGAFLISGRKEWFDYTPHARAWNASHPTADDDWDTVIHKDHYHLQIKVGHVYRAPAGFSNPNGEKTDAEKAAIIDRYFHEKNVYPWVPYVPIGKTLVEECRRMGPDGLWVSTAAALVEQESFGKNIFGCDWGSKWTNTPPFCQVAVTEERVKRLIANVRSGGGQNGVGLTQLTTLGYVLDAEKMGGAHLPRYQMRRGFALLNHLLASYDYLNALEAFNDGNGRSNDPNNPYDIQFAQKHRAWKNRLN